MSTIVITGIARSRAADIARSLAGEGFEIMTASDYDGVLSLQRGDADYYLGICQSGAGAALALAVGLLGSRRCATLSTAGAPPAPDAVERAVQDGRIAYGLAVEHIEDVVPRLIKALQEREA